MLDSHAFVICRTQYLLTCFTFLWWWYLWTGSGFLTLKSVAQQAIKKSSHASLLVPFDWLQVRLNPIFFLRREFYSGFLLLHICNDLSWVKCVFWHIFLKENSNCSQSQLVQILSPMSLSEKTRKSNRLQMSLQRQHFLLSYLKDPHMSVGPSCGVLNQRPPAQQTGASPTEPVVSWSLVGYKLSRVSLGTRMTGRQKNDQSWILRNIGPVI